MQELALEPVAAWRSRTRGRRRPGARSRGNGRGSGACGRFRGARAAASWTGSASAVSKWVRASRGRSLSIERRVRTRRSRPSGASIVPVRDGGRPSTSARYSRTISRAASAAFSRRWASSLLATTSRPEVSRSSRWTIPGRHGSPPAAPRAASASERVAPRCGPAGWTTTPAGFSTISRSASS